MTSLHDFTPTTLAGEEKPLADYRGQVVLVVNTASKCGFTPQYEGLESLYQTYRDRGFTILGFPCNQFGNQEPGDSEDIASFCQVNYGVSFPMFSKVDVKGPQADPIFQHLTREKPGVLGTRRIKWNFTKFLVDQDGRVVKRFGSNVKPADIAPHIEALLGTG